MIKAGTGAFRQHRSRYMRRGSIMAQSLEVLFTGGKRVDV